MGKGQSRLTLTLLANDYYDASSGTWTLLFTDDTLSVAWCVDASDKFSKPESVTVYILDSQENVLSSTQVKSPSGSHTTTVAPNTSFWGKTVHVALVAKGYGSLQNRKVSSAINVENLRPEQIFSRRNQHCNYYIISL